MAPPRFLTVLAPALSAVAVSAVAACGTPVDAPQTRPETAPGPVTPAAPVLPPEPATDGPCPYLAESVVEDVNGQLVAAVRISLDQPYPACFFERGDGNEQLRTWIVEGSPDAAVAVVDAAAPVATSDPAELPGGWSGGSEPTGSGAVYAVAKEGTAVVVTTNQAQTINARRIAEQVIANLGL
ncbi:MAG: DUF2020 domain-containing protein [Actinomycetota bacterium]|nr:DUF2020 domain-containing protein [Actinomycetota bacterium]